MGYHHCLSLSLSLAAAENFCWDPETGQARLIDFASSRTPQDEDEGKKKAALEWHHGKST